MTFDDTPAALRAKWEADKARRASRDRVDDDPPVDPPLGQRDLEAALRAHPDELDTYLVYADYLGEHGDEWGQLITVQHALETLPRFGASDRRDELDRRETLLRFHLSCRLWGSLGEQVYNPEVQRYFCDMIDADWRRGFVHAARIHHGDGDVFITLARGLAAAPCALVLRRLHVATDWHRGAMDALTTSPWPLLEVLHVDGAFEPATLTFAQMPRLAELRVNNIAIDLGADVVGQLGETMRPRYDEIDE